ncbi:MAG: MgtC/SapB family protein [Spongiibacter sp.]|uniref:Protein MgtC n=1 Tax=Spongiibacter thalassae TaxID=2721624 RepID=A0ABX1GGL4_9GAMM|nr:MgtC/SapB family protein [Spongiibacter thalassae]MDX1504425.1 MgtC/SapB family protein [Spongiibacter sp.]NKI17583.1 MgtC/SapB family protein [Spongiibacter thalassae]
MPVLDLNWPLIAHHLSQLAIAYALALPIGFNRETESQGAGLRTFPLVAIGCCAFLLIGRDVLGTDEAHARMLYGLMSGIGFIGGGAIIKQNDSVSGTATAAAIWATGTIGAAVAWQRYEIAIVVSLITFITLRALVPVKKWASRGVAK